MLNYAGLWIVFFLIARVLFLLYHFNESSSLSFYELVNIFIRGIWMDLSISGYVMLLVFIIFALFGFSGSIVSQAVRIVTFVLIALSSSIIITDLELYRNWGFRIDAAPLLYLKTPGEAMASVKWWLIVIFVAISFLLFIAFVYAYNKLVHSKCLGKAKWWSIPIYLFLAATMIIPIRGGFGVAPMNPGKVYFSNNLFSNHASLNVIWNLVYSLTKSGHMYREYPKYVDDAESDDYFQALNFGNTDSEKVLKINNPNVVIILLESFSAKTIEPLGGVTGVTPNFSQLCNNGLLFSNIYASGDRSDKGIVAVLSGFPAQSTQSIIKHTVKASKLPSISNVLHSKGYSTAFYYGGDPDFANIRSYLYNADFKTIVTQDDFPKSLRSADWGVHDEHLFKRFLTDLDSASAPYFKMLFTLSSHEPYDIPEEPVFPATTEENKYLSSISYTDKWLGWFFEQAKQRPWFDNTLFVLIADHGHRYPGATRYYKPEKFAIPMLWLGGAIDTVGVNSTIGGQTDLAYTLLNQMEISASDFVLSKNLLSEEVDEFAYYAFNDGFGYIEPKGVFVWDHVGQRAVIDTQNDSLRHNAFSYFSYYHKYFLGL